VTQPLIASSNSTKYDRFANSIQQRTGRLPGPYSTFLYDAIFAVARACNVVLRAGFDPAAASARRRLHEALQSQQFEGVSGPISFDDNHDRIGARYGLFNFRASQGGLTSVGFYDDADGLVLTSSPIFYDGTTNVPSDRLVIPIISLLFSIPGAIAVIVASAVALVLVAAMTPTLLIVWRSNKLIVRSSPAFLATILAGLSIALVSIFFWFGTPTVVLCHLRLWFGIVGCTSHLLSLVSNASVSPSPTHRWACVHVHADQKLAPIHSIQRASTSSSINHQLPSIWCYSPIMRPFGDRAYIMVFVGPHASCASDECCQHFAILLLCLAERQNICPNRICIHGTHVHCRSVSQLQNSHPAVRFCRKSLHQCITDTLLCIQVIRFANHHGWRSPRTIFSSSQLLESFSDTFSRLSRPPTHSSSLYVYYLELLLLGLSSSHQSFGSFASILNR
jgi:hypothetical protein